MKCPRCKTRELNDEQVLNSLSRRDNETYICNPCGKEEAFIDTGLMVANERERRFVAEIEKAKVK